MPQNELRMQPSQNGGPPGGAVYLLTPSWTETPLVDARLEPLCSIQRDEDGNLVMVLLLPTKDAQGNPAPKKFPIVLPVVIGQPRQSPAGITAGLRQLGPGVWQLLPMLIHPVVHAFIVITDVPEPAPFVNRSRVLSSSSRPQRCRHPVLLSTRGPMH